ncbi:hypothetical protein [Microbulbifer discodermiae]|uniref:hypothetical protein n=1 Tax=Microbulbifer sp. 2201CG32-9 TaxID=3232309 RepID=UPI00345B62EE
MPEVALVKSELVLAPDRLWRSARPFWIAVFVLPLCLWHITSDVYVYFRYGAPSGQIWYVFSKLFGLYGALLLWYQVVSTLLKKTRYACVLPRWTLLRHRYLGGMTLLFVAGHVAFFVTAVSLRKGVFAGSLLLPDFRDFYHSAITLGLVAKLLLLVAVLAAMGRKYIPGVWKMMHRGMFIVVALGLVHGFLIGTETRYGLYEIFYCALMTAIGVALWLRWREAEEIRL